MVDNLINGLNPLGIRIGDDSDVTIQQGPQTSVKVASTDDLPALNAKKAQQSYCDMSGYSCESQPYEDQMKELGIVSGTQSSSPKTADLLGLDLDDTSVHECIPEQESTNAYTRSLQDYQHPSESVQLLSDLQQDSIRGTALKDPIRELAPEELLESKLDNVGSLSMNLGFDLDLELEKSKKTLPASQSVPDLQPPTQSQGYGRPLGHARMRSSDMPLKTRIEGPNALLIQRLQSVRRHAGKERINRVVSNEEKEDLERAGQLPENVLKIVSFSPDSPWIGSELSDPESPDLNETRKSPFYSNKPQTKSPEVVHAPAFGQANGHAYALGNASNPALVNASSAHLTGTGTGATYGNPRSETLENNSLTAHRTIDQTDPVSENDRGRLFLQINKISNLRGLPIDVTRKPRFTLNLNNGQQSVRTNPNNLPTPGLSASSNSSNINQEFELVVGKDLNLEITMHVFMNAVQKPPKFNYTPKSPTTYPESIASDTTDTHNGTNGKPKNKVKGFFSRSPKKRQHQKFASQNSVQPVDTNKEYQLEKAKYDKEVKEFYKRSDIWKELTGVDGEYCRGYIVASHYEQDVYGVPKTFNLSLYNEWDSSAAGSGVPRSVCELNITMMFVPKLYGSEAIPESLNSCVRAIEAAKSRKGSIYQGYLTQQGGDCTNIWKRRWFTLCGSEMSGYNEGNGKKRAVIHLENVTEIKEYLTDDLWCIYEDRCFQIGFTDGEVIGFYADTVKERDMWIEALRHNASNASKEKRTWTDLVIEKHLQA